MAKTTSKSAAPGITGWLPYILGGLVVVIGLLLALLPWGDWIPWLSVSLQSLLDADYSPDLNSTRLAPVHLALGAEAIQDQAYTQGTRTPGDYLATLQTGLLTPVVTVTPRPGETLFPLPSPTNMPGLSSPFPGDTPSPTLTATPTGTSTLTTTPTPTPTLGPGTSLPSPTRGPTQAPTRRPTNPGPGTATPRATRTALPTATETTRPTPLTPTATRPSATPTRQPTATERPYPPPPYP